MYEKTTFIILTLQNNEKFNTLGNTFNETPIYFSESQFQHCICNFFRVRTHF